MASTCSIIAIVNVAVLAFLVRYYILSSNSVEKDNLLVENVNKSYDYIVGELFIYLCSSRRRSSNSSSSCSSRSCGGGGGRIGLC